MDTQVILRFIDAAVAFAIVAVFYWWTTRMGRRMRQQDMRARRIHDYYGNGRLPADAFDHERNEAA